MTLWSSKHSLTEKQLAEGQKGLEESPHRETFSRVIMYIDRARASLRVIVEKEKEDHRRKKDGK